MKTQKQDTRIFVSLDRAEGQAVEEFRRENLLTTRTEAARVLLRHGLIRVTEEHRGE